MGTRGTLGFAVDGAEKMTYTQFDAYPGGMGLDVLRWLRAALADEEGLQAQVVALEPRFDNDEPTDEDRVYYAKYRNGNVNRGEGWYSLLRETQGRPDLILESGVFLNAAYFPFDSLFCEWGYVVDVTARTLEVYKGFQTGEVEGRWAGKSMDMPHRSVDGQYSPISLVRSWSFDELPTDEEFTAELREDEEDED